MKKVSTRIPKRIVLLFSGFLIFLLLSIGCAIAAGVVRTQAYEDFISISSATNMQSRTLTYSRAIELCPERPEAYLLLLDAFGEDGIFDKTESEAFLAIYNKHHKRLPQNEEIATVFSQAGLLYINGYEDNPTVSLRMALPFFETALPLMSQEHENYLTTSCYANIGRYYRDYIWTTSTKEVTDAHMQDLLTDISATLEGLSASENADRIFNYLGFSNAVCNLIYDQRDIMASTVEEQQVLGVLDSIYAGLPAISSIQAAKTKEMAQTLTDNRQLYYDMISRAYERNGGLSHDD